MNVVLPTAPKASRDYDDITDKVPKEPPFCAYLSNLPYDADEEEITDFFKNMRVSTDNFDLVIFATVLELYAVRRVKNRHF